MTDLLSQSETEKNQAKAGALPIFIQIAELISRQIAAGHLVPDTKLPPERDMAHDYGVAVGTLRKSLKRLTEMGLVRRIQGSGNYITRTEHAPHYIVFSALNLLAAAACHQHDFLT